MLSVHMKNLTNIISIVFFVAFCEDIYCR